MGLKDDSCLIMITLVSKSKVLSTIAKTFLTGLTAFFECQESTFSCLHKSLIFFRL